VVLCSDGVANVGATGPESILARIGSEARRGIELTTVGFGMGNYNDALMEQLADQGDGRYHYVDTIEEAERIFLANLAGTLETIAKDAKVQVEFDPSAVDRWRLLGYENRDVADRDFRNDRVDAGEIGAGHSATAVYEIRLAPRARRDDTLGTLRLRWMSNASGRVEETALTLRVRDLDPSFDEASTDLRRAAVSAELAEILKHSFYAKEASWSALTAEAGRLGRADVSTRRADSLPEMVERAAELSAERSEDSDP
jgi:Ca-activated chloride channel family protein